MKLYHISHPDHFFRILETCKAPVLLVAQDGTLVDLQEYRRHIKPGYPLNEVELHVSCPEDIQNLLRFSQEACRS